MSKHYFAQHGFSLIELLMVIAIVGVLAAIGFVNLPRDRPQVREAARIIAADLTRTRSEAIRLNSIVGFALNLNSNSYRIFVDPNRDGTADVDFDGDGTVSTDESKFTSSVLNRTLSSDFPLADLSSSDFETINGEYMVWFDSRGLPRKSSNASSEGTIKIESGTNSSHYLEVKLETQGRIRVVYP